MCRQCDIWIEILDVEYTNPCLILYDFLPQCRAMGSKYEFPSSSGKLYFLPLQYTQKATGDTNGNKKNLTPSHRPSLSFRLSDGSLAFSCNRIEFQWSGKFDSGLVYHPRRADTGICIIEPLPPIKNVRHAAPSLFGDAGSKGTENRGSRDSCREGRYVWRFVCFASEVLFGL